MKKSKIIKMIIIFLIFLMMLSSFTIKLYAMTTPIGDPGDYKPNPGTKETDLQNKTEKILGVINVVGMVVSVITLMIIGIKYMFGSVEEKAEYKKTAIMYLIGAAIIFSTTTIPNILYKFASNI